MFDAGLCGKASRTLLGSPTGAPFRKREALRNKLWGIASPNHRQKVWTVFSPQCRCPTFGWSLYSLTSFLGVMMFISLYQHLCSSQASSPATSEDVSACLVMQRGTRSLHGVTLRDAQHAASPGTFGWHRTKTVQHGFFIEFVVVDTVIDPYCNETYQESCFLFSPPIWGRFPCWLVFFEGVETTNYFWFEFILFGKRQTWRQQKKPRKLTLTYLSKIVEDGKINGRFFKGLTCRVESHWLVELDADLRNPFEIRKVGVFDLRDGGKV